MIFYCQNYKLNQLTNLSRCQQHGLRCLPCQVIFILITVNYHLQRKQLDFLIQAITQLEYTVKPVHVVTSIKQSPVLKGHPFLVLSLNNSYEYNLFLEVTCLIRSLFLCPKGDLLKIVLVTVSKFLNT
jgi:hypothetical protein